MKGSQKKRRKPLTMDEVETAVDKIRQKYNDYIIEYMKPLSASHGFEERYLQALRNRVNMETFLHVEISVLEALVQREKEAIQKKEEELLRRLRKRRRGKGDFADRVLEELRKQIEKYPTVSIHPEASFEMQKLCGFMSRFYREFYFPLENVVRELSYSRTVHGLIGMAPLLADFVPPESGGEPRMFSRYVTLLEVPLRDYNIIDREEKRLLAETASLLHRIHDTVKSILDSSEIPEEERSTVEKILEVVHNGITDFRLKDLKPRA